MNKNPLLIIFILTLFFGRMSAQELGKHEFPRGDYRIMFYNVENLFDIYDDSLKRDDDFTPQGKYFWTKRKFDEKVQKISKVIIAVGQWQLPDLVGLCEVENRYVVEQLATKTALKGHYTIVHQESPDKRGIDVALLYRKEKFKLINYQAIPVHFPFDKRTTRDILYAKGTLKSGDTIHVFVNHWPSRWGGQAATDRKRIFAASVLKHKTDSIFGTNQNANIIIMGDLNDYPENTSVRKTLDTQTKYDNPQAGKLYNLAYYLQNTKNLGTHKHMGEWGMLDQLIISGQLLKSSSKINTTIDNAHVFNAPFLMEKDDKYVGYKNNRMYIGFKYHGGFSDHLPVYIDLKIKK